MAQVKNSPLVGMRGTIGDMVFRTWNGKTFVYPKGKAPRKQSAAQKRNRDRFRNASIQAKQLLADPSLQNYYHQEAIRLGLPNAYTAALKDMISQLPVSQSPVAGSKITVAKSQLPVSQLPVASVEITKGQLPVSQSPVASVEITKGQLPVSQSPVASFEINKSQLSVSQSPVASVKIAVAKKPVVSNRNEQFRERARLRFAMRKLQSPQILSRQQFPNSRQELQVDLYRSD